MIHIYCGDGKGKTTCAFGLALRAAGRDTGVVIAQFLKSEDSGERMAMRHVPGVKLLPIPEHVKFSFVMNEEEKAETANRALALLSGVEEALEAGCALAVLDECCSAVTMDMLPRERIAAFLDRWGGEREIVLTGRDPDDVLVERADYITEMRKVRHPYDKGVMARKGIVW